MGFLDDLGDELARAVGVAPGDLSREFAWKLELPEELVGPDSKLAEEIARNLAITRALGLNGTPSWVVGDRILSGAQPLSELERAVGVRAVYSVLRTRDDP